MDMELVFIFAFLSVANSDDSGSLWTFLAFDKRKSSMTMKFLWNDAKWPCIDSAVTSLGYVALPAQMANARQ